MRGARGMARSETGDTPGEGGRVNILPPGRNRNKVAHGAASRAANGAPKHCHAHASTRYTGGAGTGGVHCESDGLGRGRRRRESEGRAPSSSLCAVGSRAVIWSNCGWILNLDRTPNAGLWHPGRDSNPRPSDPKSSSGRLPRHLRCSPESAGRLGCPASSLMCFRLVSWLSSRLSSTTGCRSGIASTPPLRRGLRPRRCPPCAGCTVDVESLSSKGFRASQLNLVQAADTGLRRRSRGLPATDLCARPAITRTS